MIAAPVETEWLKAQMKEIREGIRRVEVILDEMRGIETLVLRGIELTYQNRTRFGARRGIRTLLRRHTYTQEGLVSALVDKIETKAKRPRAMLHTSIRQMIAEGRVVRVNGRLELRREL